MNRKIFDKYTISNPDESVKNEALKLWDTVMKPLGSLGELEELVVKLAGIYGNIDFNIDRRCVIVVCADHGVVSEGVSQSDPHVTKVVTEQIADGRSNINLFAMSAGADVYAVDMGILEPPAPDKICSFEDAGRHNDSLKESIIDLHVARSTRNMAEGPAMTGEQAMLAFENGIRLVERMKSLGYNIIVTGEMGIGNSTSASALCAALLQKHPSEVTGRGAGLDTETLKHKIEVIERAVKINYSDGQDVMKTLAGLGGFDISAMAGIYTGGAIYKVPVIIDGFISAVAALVAYRLEPVTREYMIASHLSSEGPGELIFKELNLKPVIHAGMRLGEGTGGVCLLPLLDIALAEFKYSHRFTDTDVEPYKKLL